MSSISETSPTLKPLSSERSILLVAKGGGIVLAGTIFSYALRLLIGMVMTRLLGAEQFGLYGIALTTASIGAGISLLGLEYALVRYVPVYTNRGDTARLWGTFQVGIGLSTLGSLLVGIGLFALATPIAIGLFDDARLIPLLRIASVIVPLYTLSKTLSAATKGFKLMQYFIISQEIVQPVLKLVLIGVVAAIGLNAANSLGIYILGLVATCTLLLYFLNRLFPLLRPIRSAIRDVRGLLKFSLPAYFSVLIDTFQGNIQTILLGTMNSIFTVGIFSVAAQVSNLSTIFDASIGTASSPVISELHEQGEIGKIASFYQTATKWMVTLNLPVFLILLLFSETFLSLFGEEFTTGSQVLIILILAKLVVAGAGIAGGILNMTGNTHFRLVNSIVHFSSMLILSFIFIPQYGAMGAAFAMLITMTLVSFLRVAQVYYKFRILPYNMDFWKPITAGAVAFFLGWISHRMLHLGLGLPAAILISGEISVAYIAGIFALGLSPDDKAVLARAQKRIREMFSPKDKRGQQG